MAQINSFDIDGVINMGDYVGLQPRLYDVIVTGRSQYDERDHTLQWLHEREIDNPVYFNPVKFEEKTRDSSGRHKAKTLNMLLDEGIEIGLHFEDDPIQADLIEMLCPRIKVVRIVHDLVEKENVWHGPNNRTSSRTDT